MRGFGFPLYVNGQLLQEPVTISHVPGRSDAQGVLGGIGIDPSMGGMGSYALYSPTRGMRGFGDDAPAQGPIDAEAQPGGTLTIAVTPAASPPVAPPVAPPPPPPMPELNVTPVVAMIAGLIDIASMSGLAYHGYRRNNSIGWSIMWALLGGAFPIIAWPVALAQGYGEPKKGLTPNRRRRHRRNGRTRRRRR